MQRVRPGTGGGERYSGDMTRVKDQRWFAEAYALGEQRITAGCGWPKEGVDEIFRAYYEIIHRELPTGRVLDIGCGQGRIVRFFAEQGYEAHGIDFVERAIEEAKGLAAEQNLTRAHFQVMDALDLQFPAKYFDIAVDWSVLDHIRPADWPRYLDNLLRVLKVGGYFILTEFSAQDPRLRGQEQNFIDRDDYYAHFFKPEELTALFGQHFEIVHEEKSTTEHKPVFVMINVLLRRVA